MMTAEQKMSAVIYGVVLVIALMFTAAIWVAFA